MAEEVAVWEVFRAQGASPEAMDRLHMLEQAVRWLLRDRNVLEAVLSESFPDDDPVREAEGDAMLHALGPYMDPLFTSQLLEPNPDWPA